MGGQMLSTGIHHILGLSRYQGTVRVGNEGRNYGSHAVSVVEGVSGMDGRVSGHKADGDLSLPLSVYVRVSVVSKPGGKVCVGGNCKVGVIRGNSSVSVVDKLGISISLSIDQRVGIHMRHHNPSGANTEGEVNSASLGDGLLMLGGGLSVVRIEGGHGTVGVGHQLGVSARN